MSSDVLVYDQDCGFCTWWGDFFAKRTDLKTVGFDELTDEQLEKLPDDYESCAHLLTEENVYSCGAAIEQALVRTELLVGVEELVKFLGQFEDYERLRERLYREFADRRDFLGEFISKDRSDE